MTGKGREPADMMQTREVDTLCKRGCKARRIGAGFKLYYHGVDRKKNGVDVISRKNTQRML